MKKHRKLIILLDLLLALVLVFALGVFFLLPKLEFVEENQVFERGEIYHIQDYITKQTGTVIDGDQPIDTSVVGTNTATYHIKTVLMEKEYEFTYQVEDTKGPVITFTNDTIQLEGDASITQEEIEKNITIDEGTFTFQSEYEEGLQGTFQVNVEAKDEYDNVSTASFDIQVEDTEPPVLFGGGYGAQVLKDSEFSFDAILGYGDNTDPTPTLETSATVDTSKTGSYPIHAKLSDDAGNITEWDFTVEVVESYDEAKPRTDFYPFADFKKDYPGEGRKYGIDVSEWQDDIDFQLVKNAGCDFAIIRIGYSYNGEFKIDKKFEQNIERAVNADMPIGIYFFSYDNQEKELRASLEKMFEILGDTQLQYPLVFDWEDFFDFQDHQMSFNDLNHLYEVFKEEVENRGYQSMLYGSKNQLRSVWAKRNERPIWLAHYIDETDYEGPYVMWQLSDAGKIDGIEGRVDLDIYYGE